MYIFSANFLHVYLTNIRCGPGVHGESERVVLIPRKLAHLLSACKNRFAFAFEMKRQGTVSLSPPPRPQCTLRWGLLSLNVSSVGKIEPFRYDRGNALKSCFGNCPNKQRSLSIRWRLKSIHTSKNNYTLLKVYIFWGNFYRRRLF